MAKPTRNAGFNGMMLRQARRYKRMTQTELAQDVGVHRTTLVRWESGMSEPNAEQIEQLAVATSTPSILERLERFGEPRRQQTRTSSTSDQWAHEAGSQRYSVGKEKRTRLSRLG
jgi:DNA-binding XRE family transcriptional regulator